MAHPKPDFTIKWGVNDEPISPIADLDQNEGWSFLGNTPPTAAQFDYMMALYDKRDAWLEERAVKAPSETDTAMLEIATQAETDAGTDDVRAVTPKKLRFGFSITAAENGQISFPSWLGGLIVQWGKLTGVSQDQTFHSVTFPIAFVTSAFNVSATIGRSTAVNGTIAPLVRNLTNTGVEIAGDHDTTASTGDIYWIAIGH